MEALFEGMSHLQFARYCRLQELPEEDYQMVAYPHPYLLIWLECRRHMDSMSGTYAYPEPEKGWLDQDAELMLAFEVLDELHTLREQAQEARIRNKTQAMEQFSSQ